MESDHLFDAPASSSRPEERTAEFERLSMPLAAALYAMAFRLTGDSARAEDLVQETYVLAWQKFERFQTGTNFKAWIFQILVLNSRNEIRGQRKLPVQLSDEAAQGMASAAPNCEPAQDLAAVNYGAFLDDDFKRALDRLDADHRLVLMLVTLGELSYQECAETLALPIGTIMSRLYRARKQLQSELYEYARERGFLRIGAGRKVT